MAEPKYTWCVLGRQLRQWVETAGGGCPIAPCTLVADPNDPQWKLSTLDADLNWKYRDHIYLGPRPAPHEGSELPAREVAPLGKGPFQRAWTHVDRLAQLFHQPDLAAEKDGNEQWVPFHSSYKYDPLEHVFKPEERKFKMRAVQERYPGGVIPAELKTVKAFHGIMSKELVIIKSLLRNHEEPALSEVTNAIYSHHFPGPADNLKYIFIEDVQNEDTREFITEELFSAANGMTFPPAVGGADVESLWVFSAANPQWLPEFEALLGTRIGRTVAFWLLGRYPRGSCTIDKISVALSGEDDPELKVIDMLFEFTTTKPPVKLPALDTAAAKKKAAAGPAPKAEPAPGVKPAFQPVPPVGGKPLKAAIAAAGPVPPPGGKPLAAAMAALPQPSQNEIARRYKNQVIKRKTEEKQEEENDARYGVLRSGKKRR